MASFFNRHPYLSAGMGMATGGLSGLGAGMLSGSGGFKNALFGSNPQFRQVPRFSDQQQQGQNQILQQALAGLQGNNFDFAPIEQQARTQFNQQTIPSIAERFTSMGQGAQRSSSFQDALGQAGSGLEQNLASMKSKYGLQQQGQLQNLLGMGMQPQFDTAFDPGTQGMAGSMISLLPMLLKLFGG